MSTHNTNPGRTPAGRARPAQNRDTADSLPPPNTPWRTWQDQNTSERNDAPRTPPRRPAQTTTGTPSGRGAARATPIQPTTPYQSTESPRTPVTGNRGRRVPLARAQVVPADAPPSSQTASPSTPRRTYPHELRELADLLNESNARHNTEGSAIGLDVSVVVAGLSPGEADDLHRALTCPGSSFGQPLTPAQLDAFIELRKARNAPLSYEELVALRTSDAARFEKDGRDNMRKGGGSDSMHFYYLTDINERRAVFSMGTRELALVANLMDRQSDTVTFIASVRPETSARVLDNKNQLVSFFHVSRSITDDGVVREEYAQAVDELKNIFLDKIGMRHASAFGQRLVASGLKNWTNRTHVPLSDAALARMNARPTAAAPPTSRPAPSPPPATRARARDPSPPPSASDDDEFLEEQGDEEDYDDHDYLYGGIYDNNKNRFTSAPPSAPPPDRVTCGGCQGEAREPYNEPHVREAMARARSAGARSAATYQTAWPRLGVELAVQFDVVEDREAVLSLLLPEVGDAQMLVAVLLSHGLCHRHALKLAAAAADDDYHGLPLSI
ncbi:hypothetical protein EXIGLDRAFT_768678 [Exidia glandulosa HHB12029]|uniref:Uncharacterized protein n=1 Tax=Exidia glandulosa HHB12029 TaxID=1314781 RepID=A0A165I1B3_EXIGL|nr:hypothetical protein EXIGLDRAFT_768678 [Exidia glandulosa HHB12029]